MNRLKAKLQLNSRGRVKSHMLKKNLLVSIHHKVSGRKCYFKRTTTFKMIEMLHNSADLYSKSMKMDLGKMLASAKFKQFCRYYFMKPILSSVHDHLGKGKSKRFNRTTNEILPTKRFVILESTTRRHSDISVPTANKEIHEGTTWPFELSIGRKLNTQLSITTDQATSFFSF